MIGERLSSKEVAPYLFLAPVAILGLAFFVGPLLFALYVSFTHWDAITAPDWVGIANYRYLLTRDPFFFTSLLHTFVFAGGTVMLGASVSLGIAVAISRSRLQAFWRIVFWLPMVISLVAVAWMWWFILNDTYGLVNRVLGLLGLPGPEWLTNPSTSMLSLIIVAAWLSIGQNVLLFLTGLAAIDESYYEAARLDGAGPARLFRHVTLPLLRPTILFVFVTNFITALSSFALMLIMTDGGPARSTTVGALYLYNMAFSDLRLGRASAAAYILFAIIFVISVAQLRLLRRGGLENH